LIVFLKEIDAIDLTGIHWVIVGGESGTKARPMKQEWVLTIKDQCEAQGAAFFFKQWGGWGVDGKKRRKKHNGRTWDAVPTQTMELGV
jgi:protein gp37